MHRLQSAILHIKHGCQAVIMAPHNRNQVRAIGRPLRRRHVARNVRELLCHARRTGGRSNPQLALRLPHRPLPIRRDLDVLTAFLFATHFAEQARLAAGDWGNPNLLLGLLRFAERICTTSLAVDLGAARIHHACTVGRQAKRCKRLARVAGIVGHLLRGELRTTGYPHILCAALGEDPRNPRALMSRCELRWKRRTQYLLNGERLCSCRLNRDRDTGCRGCDRKHAKCPIESLHWISF